MLAQVSKKDKLNLELEAILKEVERRSNLVARKLIDHLFPKQAAFVLDTSPLIAGFCTRRAGKSYGVGLKLCKAALENDGVSCIYIALTRISAKNIMLKDVLKVINKRHDLGAQFNESALTMTFPNGSIIYLIGMDSSEQEAQKALGQKFKLCVIDEAGSFRRDLNSIVFQILKPACADLRGQIILIGTPTNIVKGLFYEVVWAKSLKGWSIHEWTAFDNPYMRQQWEAEIEELKVNNPRVIETPWFRQQYLGEYVIDSSKLVYKYESSRNGIKRVDLPVLQHYVLGVDLGFDDASAFSILGYREDSKRLYVPYAFKQSELDITGVAERIRYLISKYNPYKIVIDNAAKQAVEELKNRFQLPLYAAEKHGKADFVGIMNAEFICQNIHVVEEDAECLVSEYGNLIWDERSDKRKEHPNCENHAADATLYGWRYCYQYANSEPKKRLTQEEKLDVWFERQAELLEVGKQRDWWET